MNTIKPRTNFKRVGVASNNQRKDLQKHVNDDCLEIVSTAISGRGDGFSSENINQFKTMINFALINIKIIFHD